MNGRFLERRICYVHCYELRTINKHGQQNIYNQKMTNIEITLEQFTWPMPSHVLFEILATATVTLVAARSPLHSHSIGDLVVHSENPTTTTGAEW